MPACAAPLGDEGDVSDAVLQSTQSYSWAVHVRNLLEDGASSSVVAAWRCFYN